LEIAARVDRKRSSGRSRAIWPNTAGWDSSMPPPRMQTIFPCWAVTGSVIRYA